MWISRCFNLTTIIMTGIEAGLTWRIQPIRCNQDEFDLDHNGKREMFVTIDVIDSAQTRKIFN